MRLTMINYDILHSRHRLSHLTRTQFQKNDRQSDLVDREDLIEY
jgi:hypothetical protein